MTAGALILPNPSVGDELKHWGLAAAIVCAAHVALTAGYLLLPQPEPEGSTLSPAVIMDLAPAPVSPSSQQDLAPGPEMVEAQPTPKPPPQVEPDVVDPIEKLNADSDVMLPEPKPKAVEQKAEEVPDTQQTTLTPPVQQDTPAPQTTAAPRSEQNTASIPAAPNPGSTDGRSVATWRNLIVARLQSVKRYPHGAEGNGTVMITFTLDRDGRVISRNVVRSSGSAAFDEEALAMVMRATPFPPVPAAISGPSVKLPVPIRFTRQ
jgi:protein TonB